jgi:hypothetical protein
MRMGIGTAITVIFGLLFVAAGITIYLDASRFAATAREASGVVIDVVKAVRTPTRSATHPVVRFETAEGREIVFTSSQHYYSSIGQTLPVSYNPDDPEKAKVGSLSSVRRWGFLWLGMGLLVGLGLCVIGLGLEFGLLKWRPARAVR